MPSSCAVSTVQVKPFFDEAAPLSGEQMMAATPYRPWPARITSIIDLTETEKLFEFRLIDERIRDAFSHEPGQFVEVSIFGVGEAPISISSSPSKRGFIELCVRRTGHFTEVLHKMQCGDIVGLRGPFGRGFPFEDMKGHDILLVAGGLGIAPLRSLINNIHDERSEFGKVTKPFEHLEIDAANTFGALCGPPVMYRFAIDEMRKKGISYDHIYVSFERHMKCGMGKCGHCQIGHQYVCIDGPVFNYWEAKNIQGSM